MKGFFLEKSASFSIYLPPTNFFTAVEKRTPKSSVQARLQYVQATGQTLPENLRKMIETTPTLVLSTICKDVPASSDVIQPTNEWTQSGNSVFQLAVENQKYKEIEKPTKNENPVHLVLENLGHTSNIL